MTNYQLDPELSTPVTDLSFHRPDHRYKTALIVSATIGYLILMGLGLLILLTDVPWWITVATECVIAAAFIVNLMIIPRGYRFRGYALREHDISYRKGVIFPSVTTVPYAKVQQVTLSRNPVFKLLGLFTVEVTNGAQAESSLVIAGLSEEVARHLKSVITDRLYQQL